MCTKIGIVFLSIFFLFLFLFGHFGVYKFHKFPITIGNQPPTQSPLNKPLAKVKERDRRAANRSYLLFPSMTIYQATGLDHYSSFSKQLNRIDAVPTYLPHFLSVASICTLKQCFIIIITNVQKFNY